MRTLHLVKMCSVIPYPACGQRR